MVNAQKITLVTIDPDLTYAVSEALTRKYFTIIHRIRLGALPTKSFLHKIGKLDSPNCPTCCLPTTHHAIVQCEAFHL